MQRWCPGKLCYLGFCRGRLNPVGRKCQESKWGICIILHWAKPPKPLGHPSQFSSICRSKGLLPDIFDPLITTLLELCSKVSVFIIVFRKENYWQDLNYIYDCQSGLVHLDDHIFRSDTYWKVGGEEERKKRQLYKMKKSFQADRWTLAIKDTMNCPEKVMKIIH